MENKINLPEETLMRVGFRLLDIIYGELTIREGEYYDEIFIDRDGVGRLTYDKRKRGVQNWNILFQLHKDREDFLRMFPVRSFDYERVLRSWFEERYKREVDDVRDPQIRITVR